MRRLLLFFALLIGSFGVFSQEIKEKVPSTYDRSSLTVLYIDFASGNHWSTVVPKIDSIVFSDKFDNNNIDSRLLKASFDRSSAAFNMKEAILKDLKNANVARNIIAKWYNRKADGSMNMELVHKRGRFNATDGDFLKANTSKRGNAALEDYGNRLVNLSFVLVVDISDIKTMAEANVKGQKGWKANATGYLYRVGFSEETRNAFYDTWIYDDDSEAVKQQKRKSFDALEIPIVPVTQKSLLLTSSQSESDKGYGLLVKPKTVDQLMQEMVQKSYDETIYLLEMEVEEFKVKTSLYATRPLRAKIGLKEGLKTDNRFFAYEYVYNSKTNAGEPKRRGVVRAESKSKIIDNRQEASGDMGTSRFYQVAGKKLEAGYTLQQQNDHGIEVVLAPEFGIVGGFYGRADYRLGRFVGIKALYFYGEGGMDTHEYNYDSYAFLRAGAGLAKGFQLMRNVELRPFTGIGIETATIDDLNDGEAISSLFFRGGANLALNLTHNFQLIAGVGFYGFFGDVTDKDGNSLGYTWDSQFARSSGSSLVGIKVMF
jgi:FtsZ-binding cell division protein ZapB